MENGLPESPFGEHGHVVDPSKVKRLHVDDEHRVFAYEGEQLMVLTPRLSPAIAKWLRDALYEQLDHDAREAVSKDLAHS
jgi:hypothetical protein